MQVIIEQVDDQQDEVVILRCKKLSAKHLKAIQILEAADSVIGYKKSEMHRVDAEDIFYFESVDNKIFLYTEDDVLEYKNRLLDVENTLGGDFVRVSRVVILNWKKIASLKPMLNGRMEAMLLNGEKQIISRQYVADLKRKFTG
ncbi:LytTR family transcriptional regulator [Lachnospiraceae bacterium OttesenSCG-928-E19]|nr:LytTR family transcriptional regulator [Lachnospiraceae bacterium OttesenSCG-928-E19]